MDIASLATGVLQAGTGTAQIMQSSAENKANLNSNFINMNESMARLHTIRDCVKKKFQKYWFPGNRIVLWLHEVKTINDEVEDLTKKFLNKIHILPYDLIQKIARVCANIDRVIEEGKACEIELVNRGAYRIVKLDAPINIEDVPALKDKLDQLLGYLKDNSFNSIKVHGKKGTGKSELIQHLNNRLEVDNNNIMFDIVIWLPSLEFRNGKYSSIEVGIQHIIARRLGLDVQGIEDVNILASKLHAELENAKYLLLLDDVMEATIKLETIGIPTNTEGSKIVYATSTYVSPFGEPFFGIKMESLSEGDSWQLFQKLLINENVKIVREIAPIARKVVRWCNGYISLIKIVAKIFKAKTSPESWNNGLKVLRKPAKKGDIYMQALGNSWHLSYEDLEENQKMCFLFSLLYPEEYKIPIDCLFDCWEANDLLGNDAIGEDILEHLLAMALFEKGSEKQYVTINKLYRGAAINILQEHHKFKCLVVEKGSENAQSYSWEDRHWISLIDSGIEVLPDKVNCPKLTTLFLQKNSKVKKVPNSFFDEMKELTVLDLHKAGFEFALPMTSLQKLRVLYVNGCAMLKKLPFEIEGSDNMLEVLDIRGCIINEIPLDIERLEHLRRLMVSINVDTLNHLIISKLSSLKELIIDVKSVVVHKGGNSYMTWCNMLIERIIEKFDTLDKLTTLKFCFKYGTIDVIRVSGDTLKIFVPKQGSLQHIWKNRSIHYSALQVYIGFQMTPNLELPTVFDRYDNFVLSCDKIAVEPVIEDVLLKVKALIITKGNSIKDLDQVVVPHIHHCLVQRCNEIEVPMNTNGFSNLETLVISECSKLKSLLLNNVHQTAIKHLEIRDCPAIEEIDVSSTSGGGILLTLTTLVLHNLRMLKNIYVGLGWSSVATLEIHECPMLKKIPLTKDNATNLHHIKVEKTWWKNLDLDHEIKQKFNNYCVFSD